MWQEDKPQLLLAQISKVGNGLSPVGFVEKLRDFAPLREQPDPVARMAIGLIVTQHAALIGIKGTIDAMNKEDISNLICSRFAHLALEELHKAFQLERYGELGEATAHYNLINAPYSPSMSLGWGKRAKTILTSPSRGLPERRLPLHLPPENV